jgi:hypothetical protein
MVPSIQRTTLILAAALAAGGLTVAIAPSAHAAAPILTATVTRTSVWDSGYGATVVIRNTGDATATGWTVAFDLPAGTTVTSSWSSTRTGSAPHYSFTGLSYNSKVAPGASVSFGFNAANLGLPLNCTVNGSPCAGGGTPTPSPTVSPTRTPTPSPTVTTTAPAGPVIDVGTAAQLTAALAAVKPGQTIRLAAGTYNGAFLARTAGTANAPITVTGPASAIITNPTPAGSAPGSCSVPATGFNPGYGFWLYQAPYWNLRGFTVDHAVKGIIIDASAHVVVDGVTVAHTNAEGVHFRSSSPDGTIQNSTIHDTGVVQPEYGEGIYLGSANSNWSCYGTTGGVDASDRVQVLNNHVGPNVAAEHVDVKEGTVGGVIRGNTWNGTGIAGQNSADSWLDVKGSNYTIENNTGTYAPPGVFANGYETHNPTAGSGCGNVWRNNRSDLGGVGKWAIDITSTSKCTGNPNVVYASNTVTGATSGLTNVAVTP